jgi:O-6-methylguanine DNA methyltransferase
MPTAFGVFIAHFSEHGLAQLDFPNDAQALSRATGKLSQQVRTWSSLTTKAVAAILSGERPVTLPPLDLRGGTLFQQRVWSALCRIDCGETKSYAEIAREIGAPKATRAVGGACGANPIPLLIPCHRVLASGGNLGGFSGGLDWKKRLLAIEGVVSREGELPW